MFPKRERKKDLMIWQLISSAKVGTAVCYNLITTLRLCSLSNEFEWIYEVPCV